jgi:hypothetical protein
MFVQAAGASASLAKLPPDFRPRLMDMWILNQLAETITRYFAPLLQWLRIQGFYAHRDVTFHFLIIKFNLITSAKTQYNCSSSLQ